MKDFELLLRPPKSKEVFDNNIYISAINFCGNPRSCVDLARKGEIELFTSRAILLELAGKLKEKFNWPQVEIEDILVGISKFAKIITLKDKVSAIKEDPSDNRILETAKEAKVQFINSGDKRDLLPLKEFEGIKIVSAADFLKQI